MFNSDRYTIDEVVKIEKMPDALDADKLVVQEVLYKYRACPYCGTEVETALVYYKRYGKQKPFFKHLFEKTYMWHDIKYECYHCGTIWRSPEFPQGFEKNFEAQPYRKWDFEKQGWISRFGAYIVRD